MAEYRSALSVYDQLDQSLLQSCDNMSVAPPRSKADLLKYCRSNAWFTRHVDTGEVRVASNACHLRWCPVCAEARKNYIGHAVAEWIETLKYPKLMTLTLKHHDVPLLTQVHDLYRYFKQLRKRKDFKDIVVGGVWFFQIKLSKTDSNWHPHIHCVVDGKYMPRTLLRRMWIEITIDSMIVDIKSVKDPAGCALEVARYAAKPGPLKDLDLEHAVELVTTLHGQRICGTWGVGKSVSLRPSKFTDKDKWQGIGSWAMVMSMRRTDPIAGAIFHAWHDHEPLPKNLDMSYNEDRLNGLHRFMPHEYNNLDEIYATERGPP